ncbi:MAG: bifunctional nuclease family protein [Pyrinomonadaceae bacterium]
MAEALEKMEVEVKVGALIMDPQSGTPIVVLRGIDEEVVLPIWVGTFEAHAIALEIEKNVPQRPLTHDLLRNVISELGAVIERVVITDLRDNTFFAVIELAHETFGTVAIDSRPSDAIALALRFSCSIWVRREVLETAGANVMTASSNVDDFDVDDAESSEDWPELIG